MKLSLPLLIGLLLSGVVLSVRPSLAADLYYGQVIDAETGEPLVGAAVTVIWYKTAAVYIDRTRRFQSAQETVTDAQGKFSLSVSPGIDWNPFTVIIKEPDIVIYQPGYEPVGVMWRLRMGYKSQLEFGAELKKGAVVKLSRLNTSEELRKFSDIHVHPDVPNSQIPNLLRVINIQRKNLGLQPFPEDR